MFLTFYCYMVLLMNIKKISNTNLTETSSFSQTVHEANGLGKTCSSLMTANKALKWTSPHLHQVMSTAFSAQRTALSNMPCSSRDPHQLALEVIEHRGFRPLSQDALQPRLTGKALGRMPRRPIKATQKFSVSTLFAKQLRDLEAERNGLSAQLDNAQTLLDQAINNSVHMDVNNNVLVAQANLIIQERQNAVAELTERVNAISAQIVSLKQAAESSIPRH